MVIECDQSMITLDNLDPKEEYPKPKPVERIVEVQIRREGRVMRIGSLLNTEQKKRM